MRAVRWNSKMATSKICKFYNNQNVFITGGSGFVGKVLIEKLLRSTNVHTIYVLIRAKKGHDAQKRFDDIFDSIVSTKSVWMVKVLLCTI